MEVNVNYTKPDIQVTDGQLSVTASIDYVPKFAEHVETCVSRTLDYMEGRGYSVAIERNMVAERPTVRITATRSLRPEETDVILLALGSGSVGSSDDLSKRRAVLEKVAQLYSH